VSVEEKQFLQNIRSALARYSTAEEARVLASPDRPQPGPRAALEEKIARFADEVAELHKVEVIRAGNWDQARRHIASMLEEKRVSSIALAGEDLKPSDARWKGWKIASDQETMAQAEVGVVQADYGLAETGSIVLLASKDKPRSASLLPPSCIFALSVFGMLDSMAHLMKELEERHKKGELPAAVNVVTGPSRTADIELSLTVGVHGPGEVSVVLVG
jgi:L-lactate dehydrogenase complex protein LldG